MKAGDAVEVAGRKVGDVPRRGTVVRTSGAMVRIRWASGDETSLIPAPGTLTVVGGGSGAPPASPAKRKAAPAKAKQKAAPAKTKTAATPARKKAATPAKKKGAAPAKKKKAAPAKKKTAKKAAKSKKR